MNKITKTIIGFVAFTLIITAASIAYNMLGNNIEHQNLSQNEQIKAPDFTVVDADNNEIKLSDFFGKPIVLNFWASWCPPCKQEMPDFNNVYNDIGDDVTFVMINLADGFQETVQIAGDFVESQGFDFPVYYDTLGDAGQTYAITSIPATFFIDKNGNIVTKAQGAIDEDSLLQGIDMIMG